MKDALSGCRRKPIRLRSGPRNKKSSKEGRSAEEWQRDDPALLPVREILDRNDFDTPNDAPTD
jgi:hypothetical protein